jgi:hypothetical protein
MATIPTTTRPTDDRCRRRLSGPAALLLAVCLSACARSEPPTPATWTGTNGNLDVTLTLTISSDSLWGQGTYTAKTPEELRCGGSILGQTGPVNISGQITSDGIGAHLNFGSDWSPPYSGKLAGKDTIRGGFFTGEGGECTFNLVRQH